MKLSPERMAAMDELLKHGAVILSVTQGRKHWKVRYRHAGKDGLIVVAGSGSDRRGPMNARQSVRHALGVVGGKRVGKRRAHKRHVNRPAQLPTRLTPARDPFAPLYGTDLHRKALAAAADRAWNGFMAAHMRAVGHEPVHPALRAA